MTHKPEIIKLITEGIQERKGKKIAIVDLSHIEGSAANTFIICQGSSPTQVNSIADSIREYVQEQWIVIDYGDLFVHIFLPDIREHYNLEELWSDAPITEIPDLD